MDYDYKPFLFADAYVLSNYERDPQMIGLLSNENVRKVSNMITEKIKKYNIVSQNIVVPDCQIRQAIEYYYIHQDIYSINYVFSPPAFLETVADGYVQQILDDFYQQTSNDKLDIWITRYDGTKGLRNHSTFKLKEKQNVVPISFSNRY